jgi:hypothetical protein
LLRIAPPAGCDCGILFSTYDLLISSTRPSKAEAAAIKVQRPPVSQQLMDRSQTVLH